MNCQEFRKLIGAEPQTHQPEAAAHAALCADCTHYRHEMQAMDRLIYQALSLQVATPLPQRPRLWRRPVWNLAASTLLTVMVATSAWLFTARGNLAEAAVTHVSHEQFSLVRTATAVQGNDLDRVLATVGLRLKPGALHVSYARICRFRDHDVPHLVVQTAQGPAAVMVLTQDSATEGAKQFTADGFNGVVLEAPRGVVIVLGEGFPVQAIAPTVLEAFEYEPADRSVG